MLDMLDISCAVLLVLCATQSQSGKVIRVTTTGDQSKSVYLNDKGVEVIGQKTLIMDIKACAEAVIQFAQTQQLNGGFFEVYLGSRDNSMSMMRFSGMKKKESVRGSPLDCKAFKTFWFSWEDEGTLRVGSGSIIGVREFLSLEVEDKVEIHYIIVYTAMGNEGEWKVLKDSRPEFIHPNRDGSTVIDVREDTPAHAAIYELKAQDPDEDDVTYHVIGQHNEIFGVSGSHLKILKRLDFETKENFVVTISASDGKHEVRQSMMVMVVDLVDEVPVIGPPIMNTILEELPVGTPIGQLATVVDRDRGAKLKYSLRGRDSQYFNMDPNTGEVRMRKRLDRDRRNGRRVLDQLTLTVDDHIHLQEKKLRIGVIDINDNPPMFGNSIYRVAVKENMLKDTVIANLSCVDIDDAANSVFSLVVSSVVIHKSPRKIPKKDVKKGSGLGEDRGSEKNTPSMTPAFGSSDKSTTTGDTNSEGGPAGPAPVQSDRRRESPDKRRDESSGKADDELGDIMDELFDSRDEGQGHSRNNRRSVTGSLFDDGNDPRERNPSHIDRQDAVGRNARSTNYQQPWVTAYPHSDMRYNYGTSKRYPSESNRYEVERDSLKTPYSRYGSHHSYSASDRKERVKHDNDWEKRVRNRYSDQSDPFANDPKEHIRNERNYKTETENSYDRQSYDRHKYESRRRHEDKEEMSGRKENRGERTHKYGYRRNNENQNEKTRHSKDDRFERRPPRRRRRFDDYKNYDDYDNDYEDRYGSFRRPRRQGRRNYRRQRADSTGAITGSAWMHDQRYGYHRRPKKVPVPDNWGDLLESNEPYLGPRHEEPPKRLDDILQPVERSEDLSDLVPTTSKPKPMITVRNENLSHSKMPNIITKADQENMKLKLEASTQKLLRASSEITTIRHFSKSTSEGTLMSADHAANIGDYDNSIENLNKDLGQLPNMTNNRNQLDGIMDASNVNPEGTTLEAHETSFSTVTSATSPSSNYDGGVGDFEPVQKPDVDSLMGDYDPFGDDSDDTTETTTVSATTSEYHSAIVQNVITENNKSVRTGHSNENGDDIDYGDLSDHDEEEDIDDDAIDGDDAIDDDIGNDLSDEDGDLSDEDGDLSDDDDDDAVNGNDLEDKDDNDNSDESNDEIGDLEDLDEDGENVDKDDDGGGGGEDSINEDIDLDNGKDDDDFGLDGDKDEGNFDLDDDKDEGDIDLDDDNSDGELDGKDGDSSLDTGNDHESDLFENLVGNNTDDFVNFDNEDGDNSENRSSQSNTVGSDGVDANDNVDNFDNENNDNSENSFIKSSTVGSDGIDTNNNVASNTNDNGNKSGSENANQDTNDNNGQDYSSSDSSSNVSDNEDEDVNEEDEFAQAFSTEYNDYKSSNAKSSSNDSFSGGTNDDLGLARRKRSTLEDVLGQEFRIYLKQRKKQRLVKSALKAVGRLLSISRKQRKRRRRKWLKLISKFFKTLDKGDSSKLPTKASTLPLQRYQPYNFYDRPSHFRSAAKVKHPEHSNELPAAFLQYKDLSRELGSPPEDNSPSMGHQSKYLRPEERYLHSLFKHLSRDDLTLPYQTFDTQSGSRHLDSHFTPDDNEWKGFKMINSKEPVLADYNNYAYHPPNKPRHYDQHFYDKSKSFVPGNWGFQPSKYHRHPQTHYEPDHSRVYHAPNSNRLPLYYEKEFTSYPHIQSGGQKPNSIHMPPFYQTKGSDQPWRSSDENYWPEMTDSKHHDSDTYEGSVNQNDIELEHASFESPDYDSDGDRQQGISPGRARVYEQLGLKPPESIADYNYQEPVSSKWNSYDSQEPESRQEEEYDTNNNRVSDHSKFHQPDYSNGFNEHPLSKQDRYNKFLNGELGRDTIEVNPPSLHSVESDHDNLPSAVEGSQGNSNTDSNQDTVGMQGYVSPPLSSLFKLHIDSDSATEKVPMNDYVLVPKSAVKNNLDFGNNDKETIIPTNRKKKSQNGNVDLSKRVKEYSPFKRGGVESNPVYKNEKSPVKPYQNKFIEQLLSLMKDEKMMDISQDSHFPPLSSYQTYSSHISPAQKRDSRTFYNYRPVENTRDASVDNVKAPSFSNQESEIQYKSEESFKANLRKALEAAFSRDYKDEDNLGGQQVSLNSKSWGETAPDPRIHYRTRNHPGASFTGNPVRTSAFVDKNSRPFTSHMKDKKSFGIYTPILRNSKKAVYPGYHPDISKSQKHSESRKRSERDHGGDSVYSNLRNLPKRDTAQVSKPMFEARGLSIVANSKTVDYDSMGEGDHSFTLTVLAIDKPEYGSPLTGTTMVLVEVIPVNEFTPEWVSPSVNDTGWFPSVLVPENVTVGTKIITISASDKDGGDDGRITYSLNQVTAANGKDAKELFTVEPTTGVLKTAAMLDRDPQTGGVTHLDLVITASDNGNPALSTQANMRVSLADINDNPPVFGKPLYEAILPTTWSKLSAWKMQLDVKDHDRQAMFKFKFVKGDTQKFLIDENTGTLSLSGTPDKTLPYKVLTVMVTDGGSPELNSTAQVIIHTQKYSFEQVKAAIDAKTRTEGPWVFKMLSGVFGFVLLFILVVYVCKKYGMFSSVVGPNGERVDDEISVHEGNRSRVINIAPPPDVTNRTDNSGIERIDVPSGRGQHHGGVTSLQSVEEGQEGHAPESITSVRKGHRY